MLKPHHLLLLLAFTTILFSTNFSIGSANDESRMAFIDSVLNQSTIHIENSQFLRSRVDIMFDKGHYYSDKPYMLSFYTIFLLLPIHWLLLKFTDLYPYLLYFFSTITVVFIPLMVIFCYTRKLLNLVGQPPISPQLAFVYTTFGTCILPFIGTYNNHIMEAALILAATYYLFDYKKNKSKLAPIAAGTLLGFAFLIQLVAPAIFILLTSIYFLFKNTKDLIKFSSVILLIFILGGLMNFSLHKDIRPLYMKQELYYYPKSFWLTYPTTPRLTYDQLEARLNELNMHPGIKKLSLAAYKHHQEKNKNVIDFIFRLGPKYDFYIFFHPLFVLSLLSFFALLRIKDFIFKKEIILCWIGFITLYIGLIYLKNVPGHTLGNRYFIPIMPLLFTIPYMTMKTKEMQLLLGLAFILTSAIFFPGIIRPWFPVSYDAYMLSSLGLLILLSLIFAVGFFSSNARKFLEKLSGLVVKNPVVSIFLFLATAVVSICLFFNISSWQEAESWLDVYAFRLIKSLICFGLMFGIFSLTQRDEAKT